MITAGPITFNESQARVFGVALLLVGVWAVAFLTWAVASGTVRATNWFLRPRARSAEEQQAADDAGRAAPGLTALATVGLILGFGIPVALAALVWWT